MVYLYLRVSFLDVEDSLLRLNSDGVMDASFRDLEWWWWYLDPRESDVMDTVFM